MPASLSEASNRLGAGSSASHARRVDPIAIALVALACALAFGVAVVLHRANRPEPPPPRPPLPVLVETVRREAGFAQPVRFLGRVEPRREAALAFERPGRVAVVLVDEGDRVAAGQPLARLDTAAIEATLRRRHAEREGAAAALARAETVLARQEGLSAAATTGQRRDDARLLRDEAAAALAAAAAALGELDVQLAQATLRAPFDGHVTARLLDDGATADPSQPVLRLVEETNPRVRVGVTPEIAATLMPGAAHALDIGGRRVGARIVAIRPDMDPASGTVGVLFALEDADAPPFGAIARFEATRWTEAPGFWVRTSALVDAGRGLWAMHALVETAEGHRIERVLADALAVHGSRTFVQADLAEGRLVVVEGALRVAPGQTVVPQPEA